MGLLNLIPRVLGQKRRIFTPLSYPAFLDLAFKCQEQHLRRYEVIDHRGLEIRKIYDKIRTFANYFATYQTTFLSNIYLSNNLSIQMSFSPDNCSSNFLSIQLSIYPSEIYYNYLAIYLSIKHLSIQLSIYPIIYLSNYLSI